MSNTVKTTYTGSSQMSFTVSGSKKEEEILWWQYKVWWNQMGIQQGQKINAQKILVRNPDGNR